MQRSILLFENSIHSLYTLKKYKYYLDLFIKFYHLKDFDSVVSMDKKQLQIFIEDYIMDLKKRVNPNSVPNYINPIQLFLDVNDFDINWKKIHRLYPQKIKRTGKKPYTTEDIKKMLNYTRSKRTQALIHLLASTGCRVGAIPELKLKHLKKIDDNCYSILFYEDSTEEYVSFLTPESSKSLDAYVESRKKDGEFVKSDSPLFRIDYNIGIAKVKPISIDIIAQILEKITKQCSIREKKSKQRYDKMVNHAFRKRFETILKLNKDIPIAVSEKLIGHKVYFDERGNNITLDDSYVTPEIQQLFKFFKLAIPELTVNDSERDKIKIQKLENEKTELFKEKENSKFLSKRLDKQDAVISDMKILLFDIRKNRK